MHLVWALHLEISEAMVDSTGASEPLQTILTCIVHSCESPNIAHMENGWMDRSLCMMLLLTVHHLGEADAPLPGNLQWAAVERLCRRAFISANSVANVSTFWGKSIYSPYHNLRSFRLQSLAFCAPRNLTRRRKVRILLYLNLASLTAWKYENS